MNGPYIFLAYAGLFIMGIIDNARGPIYPELLETFHLNPAQGSWVFTLASLTSFLMAITVSWWLKKFKDVGSTKLALVLAIVSALVMGLTGKQSNGFYFFLGAIFLLGICMGVVSVTINLIVVKNTSLHLQRRVLSGLHAMYGLSSLLSPLVISYLYDRGISWSYYFYTLAAVSLFALVITKNTKSQAISVEHTYHQVPWRLMIWVGLLISCYIAAEVLISSRIVYYLVETQGLSKSNAGNYLTLFFLLLLLGRFGSSFLGNKISSFTLMLISLVLTLILAITSLLWRPELLAWTALAMAPFYPASIDWVTGQFPKYAEDIISKIMIAVGAMLTMLHIFFGVVATEFGIFNAMTLVWGYITLSLLCLIYMQFSSKVAKFKTQS